MAGQFRRVGCAHHWRATKAHRISETLRGAGLLSFPRNAWEREKTLDTLFRCKSNLPPDPQNHTSEA